MPSMASKVGAHNNRLERDVYEKVNTVKLCTCPKEEKKDCEWNGECFRASMVYKCTIIDPTTKVELGNYIGMTGGDPKHRVSVHYNTFGDRSKIKKTKLSEKIWRMKDEGISYELKWEKLANAKPHKANQNMCNLCCKEALLILKIDK